MHQTKYRALPFDPQTAQKCHTYFVQNRFTHTVYTLVKIPSTHIAKPNGMCSRDALTQLSVSGFINTGIALRTLSGMSGVSLPDLQHLPVMPAQQPCNASTEMQANASNNESLPDRT